jgi:hypothetical protein
MRSSLFNFLQPPVTSARLGPNILLSNPIRSPQLLLILTYATLILLLLFSTNLTDRSYRHSQVPNLTSIFCCLGRSKESVQIQGPYTIRNTPDFHGEELLAPCPKGKLEDHRLSAVNDCLFKIFPAIIHIWKPSPPSKTLEHAMSFINMLTHWQLLNFIYSKYTKLILQIKCLKTLHKTSLRVKRPLYCK